jgi:hypothetical protein
LGILNGAFHPAPLTKIYYRNIHKQLQWSGQAEKTVSIHNVCKISRILFLQYKKNEYSKKNKMNTKKTKKKQKTKKTHKKELVKFCKPCKLTLFSLPAPLHRSGL